MKSISLLEARALGGAEMYFVDGRPPICDLAVAPEAIAKVIGILEGSSLQR